MKAVKTRSKAALSALALCIATLLLPAASLAAEPPAVSARSSILIEASTRCVLAANGAFDRRPMASTTKVMTALVALENCELDDIVRVPDEAYGVEGSSMYLQRGEAITLRDLLYGLMLTSGNDAAVAIAVHVGGSREGFAKLMNERAAELGAQNTHFVTPNGLHDEEHYTTAFDLALISAAAMDRADFREIVSTQYYRSESGNKTRVLKNKNRLLWEFDGGTGIKTGFTKAAGKCLVFSAERDGMRLIGVVLASADIFADAEALLDFGFYAYEMKRAVVLGSEVASLPLAYADKKTLALTASRDIMIPVESGRDEDFLVEVTLNEGCSELPISEGDILGGIIVYRNGAALAACELVAGESAHRLDTYGFFAELAAMSVR